MECVSLCVPLTGCDSAGHNDCDVLQNSPEIQISWVLPQYWTRGARCQLQNQEKVSTSYDATLNKFQEVSKTRCLSRVDLFRIDKCNNLFRAELFRTEFYKKERDIFSINQRPKSVVSLGLSPSGELRARSWGNIVKVKQK